MSGKFIVIALTLLASAASFAQKTGGGLQTKSEKVENKTIIRCKTDTNCVGTPSSKNSTQKAKSSKAGQQ